MKKISVIFIFFITAYHCLAQKKTYGDIDVELLAEEILALQDLDLNYEDLYENLLQILSNPLDLNKATTAELRALFILSENQIQALINYRQSFGPFLSVYELQAVDGFDLPLIYRMLPFVQVRELSAGKHKLPASILHAQNRYLINRFERTIQTKRGYTELATPAGTYMGGPEKIYNRFRSIEANNHSIGFTLEKDAGEPMRWSPSNKYYGFDFVSGHILLNQDHRIKTFVLGDFQLQYGQGLVYGGGFGIGKGAETITTVRRPNRGIIPYTSVGETGFFRGAATKIQLHNKFNLTTLYSSLAQDASIQNDSTASSLLTSGLHRTENEIRNRKFLQEKNLGLILSYQSRQLESGLTFLHTDFSLPINRTPRQYNYFAFNGEQNTLMGAYLNYNTSGLSFFSEAARSSSGGVGLIAGMLNSIGNRTESSIVIRSYDANFHSFYSQALSENSVAQNERAIYWGIKQTLSNKLYYAAYADVFRFPWMRSRAFAPSEGHEYLMRFTYRPGKESQAFVMFREESKTRNTVFSENLYSQHNGIKRNLIVNFDYGLGRRLTMKTRWQYSHFSLSDQNSNGMLLVQDLNFKVKRFSVGLRQALFDTDDFENRQYVFERDVLFAFSIPALQGQGVRNYALIHYKAGQHLDLWIRYARTFYTDREFIGSGAERIEGNIRSDIKLQTQWRF